MSKFLSLFLLILGIELFFVSAISHPIQRLEGVLCIYSDHLVEDREYLHHFVPKNDLEKEILNNNIKAIEERQSGVDIFFSFIEDIRRGDKTLDGFLEMLLKERLQYLKHRTDLLLNLGNSKIAPLATDPILSKEDERRSACPVLEKRLRKNEVTAWEYLQVLIKTTFDLIDKAELTADVRMWLHVSPSIWNLLANKTHDLGYPDQAGVYGPFLFVRDLLPDNKNWFAIALDWHKFVWGKIPNIDARSTNLTEDQWLKGYEKHLPHLDGELFRIFTEGSIATEPSLMLGAKPNTRISIDSSNKWGYLSPDISNLLGPKGEVPFVEEVSFSEAIKSQEASVASPPIIDYSVTPSEEPKASISQEPTAEDEELAKGKEPQKSQKEISTSEGIQTSAPEKTYSFVFPRGLRLFRQDLTSQTFKPCAKPDKKIQNFVDILFNPKQQCNATFDEFEAHWKQLGGAIIGNRGGSHRQLIGPDGTPWFGIYDHGGFGKSTIVYLQAAFVLAGYKPSAYDSLVLSN
ncbi:MAG: hypothetical protein ACK5PQ_01495 [Alphaproteobacteria bacterium]